MTFRASSRASSVMTLGPDDERWKAGIKNNSQLKDSNESGVLLICNKSSHCWFFFIPYIEQMRRSESPSKGAVFTSFDVTFPGNFIIKTLRKHYRDRCQKLEGHLQSAHGCGSHLKFF